mgnify:CR=1 FL=1
MKLKVDSKSKETGDQLFLLEMDYAEFDAFVADLDPERWRKRPHELTDCWTDRRRAREREMRRRRGIRRLPSVCAVSSAD